jgi:4'-phosphopantetheinyl transferase EntD
MLPLGVAAAAGRALASLFDGLDVIVETASVAAGLDELFPEELLCIASAVPRRQAEFATARVCARAALSRLGIQPAPLVPGRDRSPRWPTGVVGSISHADGLCAVAVARGSDVESIGIDVETSSPLEAELERVICTPNELRWLDAHDAHPQRGRWAKLLFSAKESLYKCQYPISRQMLDFADVELSLDTAAMTFSGTLRPTGLRHLARSMHGRWVWTEDFVLTRTVHPG